MRPIQALIKAGSWPIALAPGSVRQRRYPWGNSFENDRANLWGTGLGETVGVDEFADGVSVGGVYQLIGNVWEWTAGDFRGGCHSLGELVLPTPMKSIRGGAFDTYFDNQATCQFQSGENPLQRRHNIGLRCAIGTSDMNLTHSQRTQAKSSDQGQRDGQPAAEPEEVHA